MRKVICGMLNEHCVAVDTLTGETILLDDEHGNMTLTYLSVINPSTNSNENVYRKLIESWGVKGVILAQDYHVRLTEKEAMYYRVSDMSKPFFTTQYGYIEYKD